MSNLFLLNHIRIAWTEVVQNERDLYDGLVNIAAQKRFISSLHNAIEITYKQYMINKNDHEILREKKSFLKKVFRIKTKFEKQEDLNMYFNSLSIDDLNKLYTIEFSRLIKKIHKDIKNRKNISIKKSLKLLNKLRNQETHFNLNSTELMSFCEYKEIYDMMCILFEFFEENMLFGYFGECNNEMPYVLKKHLINECSYSDLVKQSKTNNKIIAQLGINYNHDFPSSYVIEYVEKSDVFAICKKFYDKQDDISLQISYQMKFNEFYQRIELMLNNNVIEIVDDGSEEVVSENGEIGYIAYATGFRLL